MPAACGWSCCAKRRAQNSAAERSAAAVDVNEQAHRAKKSEAQGWAPLAKQAAALGP